MEILPSLSKLAIAGFLFMVLPCSILFGSISDAEADAIIAEEVSAKSIRDAELKARLESVPALSEITVQEGSHRLVMRRIDPPVVEDNDPGPPQTEPHLSEEEDTAPTASPKPWETLSSVFITAHTDGVSRIQWKTHTVWSRVSFIGLPAFGTIETDTATYSYFAMFTESAEASSVPDSFFPAESASDFVVLAEDQSALPEELFLEVELLHNYYLANETALKTDYEHARSLQAARERYLEANPPAPREAIINFWPVRSRMHRPDSLQESPVAPASY